MSYHIIGANWRTNLVRVECPDSTREISLEQLLAAAGQPAYETTPTRSAMRIRPDD